MRSCAKTGNAVERICKLIMLIRRGVVTLIVLLLSHYGIQRHDVNCMQGLFGFGRPSKNGNLHDG